MFVVTVDIAVTPGSESAFLDLMRRQARTSLDMEPACLQFDICRDPENGHFFLYEVYMDRAAFEAHLESAHYLDFDAAVRPLLASKSVHTYDWVVI